MYYVYIIQSELNNKKYIGFSGDLKERFKQHNKGNCATTAKYKPWKLIYYEAFISKTDALREELFLKSGKGRERIRYLLKNNLNGEVA